MKYSIAFVSAMLFFSCEKTLEFEIPSQENKIVVHSLFSKDSQWAIRVEESQSLLDSARFTVTGSNGGGVHDFETDALKDATVQIFENGIFAERLTYSEGLYISQMHRPTHGKDYTLRIASPGLKPIEANSKIPDKVEITGLGIESTILPDNFAEYKFTLSLNDPKETDDYYLILIYRTWNPLVRVDCFPSVNLEDSCVYERDYYENEAYSIQLNNENIPEDLIFKADDAYLAPPRGFYFSDKLFEFVGKDIVFKDIKYIREELVGYNPQLRFELFHITKEYYDFVKSIRLQNTIKENPFAEPVPIPSNIINGFGVFGASSIDSLTIKNPGYVLVE